MYYIDARNLVHLAEEHGLFTRHTQVNSDTGKEETGFIVYLVGKDEPELWDEEVLIRALMEDAEGESALLAALAERGIEFKRFEGSDSDRVLNTLCVGNSEKFD